MNELSSSSVNYSLLLITLCIISLSSGIKFGEIANNNNRKIIVPFRFIGGEKNLYKSLILFYLIAIIVTYFAKYMYASGRGGGAPYLIAIFIRILHRLRYLGIRFVTRVKPHFSVAFYNIN